MTIIYTPIDIEFEIPDEQEIVDWFNNHKIKEKDYWEYEQGRHEWCYVALRKEPKDWHTYEAWLDWSTERKPIKDAGLFFYPGFEERFPGLAKCVRELPFAQIGTSGFIMQIGEIPPHQDAAYEITEPRRYIIYVTDPDYNTFYLEHQGKRIFPEIDKKYRCFAFNNSDVQHGAVPTNRTKILLSTVGIMDETKHQELLERSIKKFADKVLRI
jgi:hypothetical protein